MEENRSTEKKENDESERQGVKHGFQTMPRMSELTDSEKLARIESAVEEICMRMGEEEDRQSSYDRIIDCFNSMKKSSDELKSSLDSQVFYTRGLEDKLKRKNVEYENILLKNLLGEERSKMTLAFEKYSQTISDGLTQIQTRLEVQEKAFNDKCDVFDSKLDEFCAEKDSVKAMKDLLQKMIEDFRQEINRESDREKLKLSNDCTNVLEACNQRMAEIKKDVVTFLKTCEEQNEAIISKIPEQKRRFSWKDVMVYAVCATSLACNLVSILTG